jgi:hypothetical protein
VRPNAARNAKHENPARQKYGARALRDTGAYGVAPELVGNGRAHAGEAALAGAVEDLLQRLGHGEAFAAAAWHDH